MNLRDFYQNPISKGRISSIKWYSHSLYLKILGIFNISLQVAFHLILRTALIFRYFLCEVQHLSPLSWYPLILISSFLKSAQLSIFHFQIKSLHLFPLIFSFGKMVLKHFAHISGDSNLMDICASCPFNISAQQIQQTQIMSSGFTLLSFLFNLCLPLLG